MTLERRRDRRCAMDSEEVYVSVLSGRKSYPVKDVGKGGLSIEYSPVTDEPFETESVEIIEGDYNGIYISKISCQTDYDIATLIHGRSFKGGVMRTRGLKFVEFTKEKEDELDILIKRCFERSGK